MARERWDYDEDGKLPVGTVVEVGGKRGIFRERDLPTPGAAEGARLIIERSNGWVLSGRDTAEPPRPSSVDAIMRDVFVLDRETS